ncbi:hypothetical protein [Pendulispora albinea]|uniref:Uncharacterized protein n=1 Tax=Pendulispora albinea TaxID=2741071 RepID=A0ABZ2MA21_9BACT
MATKTKTLTSDLCPKKPDAKILDIGDTKVVVDVTLESKSSIPSSKFDRCIATASQEIDRYTQVISEEVRKLEAKARELLAKGDTAGAKKMAAETSTSVQGAVKSMQGQIDKAVLARLRKEAQGDRNLLEARVAIVVRTTFKLVSIANQAFTVAATGGAAIQGWYGLAKDIYELVQSLYEATKGEKALRGKLLEAMGKYFTDKQRQVIQREQADKSFRKKLAFFAKEIHRKLKPKADAAEEARKKYRNEVTRMRQSVDRLFKKVDGLEAKLKQAGSLREGVRIGAKLMTMKRGGRTVRDVYTQSEKFADDMAMLLTEAGMEIDDSTFTQRLAKLKNPGEVLSAINELRDGAKGILELVENLS